MQMSIEVSHAIGIGCILIAWATMIITVVFLNDVESESDKLKRRSDIWFATAVSVLSIAQFAVGISLILR
jgi:hypothetical protein